MLLASLTHRALDRGELFCVHFTVLTISGMTNSEQKTIKEFTVFTNGGLGRIAGKVIVNAVDV